MGDRFSNGNSRIFVATATNVAFEGFGRNCNRVRRDEKRISGCRTRLPVFQNGATKLENCIVFQRATGMRQARLHGQIFISR